MERIRSIEYWSNKSLAFLGLDETEVKILNALHMGKSPSELAKDTKTPRTTCAFLINKLIKKGLVLPVRYGKRSKYVALTEEQLKSKIF
jgi:DNA-binding MarR family transcriptional regulator